MYDLRRFRKLESSRTNIHSHKDHSGTDNHDHEIPFGIPLEASSVFKELLSFEYHNKLFWTRSPSIADQVLENSFGSDPVTCSQLGHESCQGSHSLCDVRSDAD